MARPNRKKFFIYNERAIVSLPMPRPMRLPDWVSVEVETIRQKPLRPAGIDGGKPQRIKKYKP